MNVLPRRDGMTAKLPETAVQKRLAMMAQGP